MCCLSEFRGHSKKFGNQISWWRSRFIIRSMHVVISSFLDRYCNFFPQNLRKTGLILLRIPVLVKQINRYSDCFFLEIH